MTTTTRTVTGRQIITVLDTIPDSPSLSGQIDYATGIYRYISALGRLTENGSGPVSGAIINRAAVEALDLATYGEPYPGNAAGIVRARDTAKALLALLSGDQPHI